MNRCYDCAVCTQRPELNLGPGRSRREVAQLAASCAECRHRFARHMHGSLRVHGWAVREEVFPVGRPARDSPLGQLLVGLGQYDDYYASIARTREPGSAEAAEPTRLRESR
jgi:hypothetical protein